MEKLIKNNDVEIIKDCDLKSINGGGPILEGIAFVIGFLAKATEDYSATVEEYCGEGSTFNARHGVCM